MVLTNRFSQNDEFKSKLLHSVLIEKVGTADIMPTKMKNKYSRN